VLRVHSLASLPNEEASDSLTLNPRRDTGVFFPNKISGARSKVPHPGQIPILQAADIVITNLSKMLGV